MQSLGAGPINLQLIHLVSDDSEYSVLSPSSGEDFNYH